MCYNVQLFRSSGCAPESGNEPWCAMYSVIFIEFNVVPWRWNQPTWLVLVIFCNPGGVQHSIVSIVSNIVSRLASHSTQASMKLPKGSQQDSEGCTPSLGPGAIQIDFSRLNPWPNMHSEPADLVYQRTELRSLPVRPRVLRSHGE